MPLTIWRVLREKCRLLSETPGIGRERPDIQEGIRSFPVGNYQIFYQTKNNEIIVIRVLSGYRDIPSLFGK